MNYGTVLLNSTISQDNDNNCWGIRKFCRDMNPGPVAQNAGALSLSHASPNNCTNSCNRRKHRGVPIFLKNRSGGILLGGTCMCVLLARSE